MNRKRKIVSGIIAGIVSVTAFIWNITDTVRINADPEYQIYEDYSYYNSGSFIPGETLLSIMRYAGTPSEVMIIPEEINGEKVEAVNGFVFYNNRTVRKIIIPDSVKYIGECAFESCINLEEINLPKNINTIEHGIFMGCTGLKNISLPEGTEYIQRYAFSKSGITECTVPDNVKRIAGFAFYDCKDLKKIELPDKLEYLGERVFTGCINLESIILPDCCADTGWLLANCTSLKNITLPETMKYLGDYMFAACTSLEKIKLPDKLTHIEKSTFESCIRLKEIIIPKSVVSVSDDAFKNCYSLRRMYGYKGSPAETYAAANGIRFVDIESNPDSDSLPCEGDADNNGTVNTSDMVTLASILINAEQPENMETADVYHDSEINALDLMYLKLMLMIQ